MFWSISMIDDWIEYEKGRRDCKNGLPAKLNANPEYDRGYATQYELEQMQTAQTEFQ